MSDAKFFVVRYGRAGAACPAHLSGEFNHDEWEWNVFEPSPATIEIKRNYVFSVTDSTIASLNFDFYGSPTIFVSARFVSVCDDFGVKFRAIPMTIVLKGVEINNYSIFLIGDSEALIDVSRSEFAVERDLETKDVVMSRIFEGYPLYCWIKTLSPRENIRPHLFRCIETMELVCSAQFKRKCDELKINCIDFVPIDSNYIYDPWDEMRNQ